MTEEMAATLMNTVIEIIIITIIEKGRSAF